MRVRAPRTPSMGGATRRRPSMVTLLCRTAGVNAAPDPAGTC
jgi:hypothetical protein